MYRCAVYRRLLSAPESANLIAILTPMNIHIRPYSPEHCQAVLNLSLRAWQPVFAQMQPAVPPFVYTNFYPNGWEARQLSDLQAVLDGEPEHVWLACAGSEIAGWTAIRLHPEVWTW